MTHPTVSILEQKGLKNEDITGPVPIVLLENLIKAGSAK